MKQSNLWQLKIQRICAVFFILVTTNALGNNYQIDHLEPMSWWSGMKGKKLQLMVHGKNISDLSVIVEHSDIAVVQVNTLDNPNYLVIDLQLSESLQAGTYAINFVKNGKTKIRYPYKFSERNKDSAAKTSYGPQDVIYLITPDRFANGDPNNDQLAMLSEGVNRANIGGRHGGDIQGIIDNLEYIRDMGFTQIWSQPLIENNQPAYSYHGYSATDFYQIDGRFGSNQLFKELSHQAQALGIGLLKDVVLNHIGDKHWWLEDLPAKDWLNFQGQAFTGTHHKRQSLHDPHATEKDKRLFSDGWFVATMPDLNQRHPVLANYLIQNTLWWIEFANLSGLRVDTYSYPDRDFLSLWTKRVTEEFPNINIVGEEWTTNPALVSYWQRGKNTHDGYVSYLPTLMDFPTQDALVNGLKDSDSWNTGLNSIYQSLANDFQYPDPYSLVVFADNHDMSRIYTQLNNDLDLFKIALGFLFTTRGIPQVYYGTEVLMANTGTEDHGAIRSDFPGGWHSDLSSAITQKGLSKQQVEAQNYIKKLLNWRKNATAIHRGKLTHFAPNKGVYVYFRSLEQQTVMVVINKNNQEVILNPNDYSELIPANSQAKDVITSKYYSLNSEIKLNSKSILILNVTS
ncbi:MAG: glycoside hydrolase family 13 protein [Paraglaciecola sp.]|uniref:glycoside hydrolase family 13 protein n=1 Tax=Paraglaciecola sp. TaxID=1920173 RepID=UPI003264D5FE